jgi:hypothetical protein
VREICSVMKGLHQWGAMLKAKPVREALYDGRDIWLPFWCEALRIEDVSMSVSCVVRIYVSGSYFHNSHLFGLDMVVINLVIYNVDWHLYDQ